jgi:Zn-dependent oligopeptidase
MALEFVQKLQQQLQHLQGEGQRANPSSSSLQQAFLMAQQTFQNQIMPLAASPPVGELSIQPILTEMNRTFRLLAMDVAFMQTVRNSATTQQRQRQMKTKIEQLLGFCGALHEAVEEAKQGDSA